MLTRRADSATCCGRVAAIACGAPRAVPALSNDVLDEPLPSESNGRPSAPTRGDEACSPTCRARRPQRATARRTAARKATGGREPARDSAGGARRPHRHRHGRARQAHAGARRTPQRAGASPPGPVNGARSRSARVRSAPRARARAEPRARAGAAARASSPRATSRSGPVPSATGRRRARGVGGRRSSASWPRPGLSTGERLLKDRARRACRSAADAPRRPSDGRLYTAAPRRAARPCRGRRGTQCGSTAIRWGESVHRGRSAAHTCRASPSAHPVGAEHDAIERQESTTLLAVLA